MIQALSLSEAFSSYPSPPAGFTASHNPDVGIGLLIYCVYDETVG